MSMSETLQLLTSEMINLEKDIDRITLENMDIDLRLTKLEEVKK